MTWHRPRSGSSKTRPIKSVPSRVGEGRVEVGEVGSGGGRSDSATWKTVVGAVNGKASLAGGMPGVGGEVVRKTVKTRPGREGRVGAPRAHKVKGKFSVG